MSMILGTVLLKFAVLFILLVLTVFFTASETALTVLRRTQTKRLIKDKGVIALKAWLDDPNRLLTTTLLGTAGCVVSVSVLSTTIALQVAPLIGLSATLATILSTVLVIAIVLVFAEIVPKTYARRNAEKVSAFIIKPLRVADFILMPFVLFFTKMSEIVITLFGGKSFKEHPLFAIEEIKGLIEMGVKEGVIANTEKKMLSQIIKFDDTIVREIMVPRVDMKVLDISLDDKIIISDTIKYGHSRIPVCSGNIDNIIGILYVKDMLPVFAKEEKIDIEKILRKPYYVPETKRIGELLREFKQGREHIAIVVDEYGISTGLATIEDVLEEITGEIFDEYDVKKQTIRKKSKNTWEIDAGEDLDKINDDLEINLPEDEYDSLGGLICGELGHVPKEGEELEYLEYKFKVLQASPNRVLKVSLEILSN